MKIRKATGDDPFVSRKRPTGPRELSATARARLELDRKIERTLLAKLTGHSSVFEVVLEDGEKTATMRQRILRLAKAKGVEVAVRVREDRLYVGLLTPERRTTRGRRAMNG